MKGNIMKKAFIKTPIASLYRKPDSNISLEDEVLFGMEVEAEEAENGFFFVKTHYGYTGYVSKKDLLFCSRRVKKFSEMKDKYKVIKKSFCDILSEPKMQGIRLITLPRGSRVALTETLENNWVRVYLCDGTEGYTRIEHLDDYKTTYDVNDEDLRDALVKTAESYLGTQYRWGGKTPSGIDCSGLCSMAYMLCGIIIYRDAKLMQGYPVKEIPYEQLKRGDLVYSPGHIMMYIGDGKIIHSSSSMCGVSYSVLPEKDKITACGSIFA